MKFQNISELEPPYKNLKLTYDKQLSCQITFGMYCVC